METADLVHNAFAMLLASPSFPRGPYRHSNCEHIITYHADRAEQAS